MAFWLDRFRREDEEDIWEELRQMILNAPSENEIALKNKEEQAFIDSILEKAFPDITKPQAEPYLKYEDLLDNVNPKDNGKLTGMATPIQEGQIVYKERPTPYEEIDAKKDWSDELKAQKKAEVAKIQEAYEARDKEITREHILEQAKNYGGAALEIGSLAVPSYGGVKLAGTVAKNLAPKVGRKIANEVATGVLKGASSGTVEGLGRGLLEDENILKTVIQDTIAGAALGTSLGTAGANVQKVIKGKNLKQYGDIDMLDKISRKQYSKNAREYYQDYVQGVNLNKNGKIVFSKTGNQEQLRWNPQGAINYPELRNDIKNATRLPNETNKDKGKIFTDYFEIYRGKLGDHLIEVDKNNGPRRFYMTRSTPSGTSHATSTDSTKSANNIIQPLQTNLNPSQSSIQKPISHNEWLEELKRRRKKRGWW